MDYAIRLSLQEQRTKSSSTASVSAARPSGATASAVPASQETEDEILARVLAQSELEYRNSQQTATEEKKESCSIN
jgi:hypothetical protein